MKYREMELSDYESIVCLWQQSEGVKLRDADTPQGIGKYLTRNPGLSFIAEDDDIIGTIMSGHVCLVMMASGVISNTGPLNQV